MNGNYRNGESYDRSGLNYIDHYGKFCDRARIALTEDGYEKQAFDIYFEWNYYQPTAELYELYQQKGSEKAIKYLESLK